MSRKAKSPEDPREKWQIVLEGLKSGNVAPEACRKHEIAPNLYYRWKKRSGSGSQARAGGGSAAARPTSSASIRSLKEEEVWLNE
jgi:transposase-like protein